MSIFIRLQPSQSQPNKNIFKIKLGKKYLTCYSYLEQEECV